MNYPPSQKLKINTPNKILKLKKNYSDNLQAQQEKQYSVKELNSQTNIQGKKFVFINSYEEDDQSSDEFEYSCVENLHQQESNEKIYSQIENKNYKIQ